MYYEGYHGSPGEVFSTFDPERSGTTSGEDHARGVAAFTSSFAVAADYAGPRGFIGRFGFRLEHPLILHDRDRGCGIAETLRMARDEGHDGVVLVDCHHTAISPGEPSTILYLFDPLRARRLEIVSDPLDAEPETPIRHTRPLPR